MKYGFLRLKRFLKSQQFFLDYLKLWIKIKLSRKLIFYDINDTKTYPIIIISFNQLFYLKKQIDFLKNSGFKNIIIIDNASTYKPLLDYFKEIKKDVTIFRLKKNYGHKVFWVKKEFLLLYGQTYYVVTDPDIVPDRNCPEDFMEYFKNLLQKNPNITKVGFSLKIDDIPCSNPHRNKILNWEKKFWENTDEVGNYWADIDTTFALYRPTSFLLDRKTFFKAIRSKPPYLAMHGGWYMDIEALTEEQKNYMETANQSSSWRINKKGDLINPQYK